LPLFYLSLLFASWLELDGTTPVGIFCHMVDRFLMAKEMSREKPEILGKPENYFTLALVF